MSEVIDSVETTEVATLPPAETAMQVYQTPKGLDPYIDRIREEVTGQPVDLTTKKGRDAVASRAFKVRKFKTALDSLGKEQVDRLKEIPKLIDAERKRMRDEMDKLADEVRKPLTEWEQAEESRIGALRVGVERLRDLSACIDGLTSAELWERLNEADSEALGEHWQEYETEAARAKESTINALRTAIAAREKYEAEQAELAELRRKQAEQEQKDRDAEIARQAAEQARADAEAKAQAERDAAAKREANAKAAQAKAEQDAKDAIERQKQAEAHAEAEKLAAEQRAKDAAEKARQAEIKRQADEKAAAEAEQRRREADKQHKAGINNAALAAFIGNGLPEECARQAVVLIAKGLIPAVNITY